MRFALILALSVACGPRVNPEGPDTEPTSDEKATADSNNKPRSVQRPQLEVLVGEMCPAAADGRPGVMPTFMRRISWDDDRDRIQDVLERNMAKQFSVLGWQGKRVGVFTAAGAATKSGVSYAMGAYAGGTACETLGAESRPIPDCEKTMLSCGLAVGVLRPAGGFGSAPFEEDPDPDSFNIGGSCVKGKNLLVDIDSDGVVETFPTSAFLNPFRAPAEEVSAIDSNPKDSCTPSFATRGVISPGDPRDWRGLDILGVIDLDADGRLELIGVYNYQDRRTWVVYSAQTSATRLELVVEGQPWARPAGSSQTVTGADLPKD